MGLTMTPGSPQPPYQSAYLQPCKVDPTWARFLNCHAKGMMPILRCCLFPSQDQSNPSQSVTVLVSVPAALWRRQGSIPRPCRLPRCLVATGIPAQALLWLVIEMIGRHGIEQQSSQPDTVVKNTTSLTVVAPISDSRSTIPDSHSTHFRQL